MDIYIGYDSREDLAYQVCSHSIKSISNNVVLQISKILEQYQIEIIDCMDRIYIENLFKNKNNDFFEMVYQVRNGINNNEIRIVPKYPKKLGIFEKFFQLFS